MNQYLIKHEIAWNENMCIVDPSGILEMNLFE